MLFDYIIISLLIYFIRGVKLELNIIPIKLFFDMNNSSLFLNEIYLFQYTLKICIGTPNSQCFNLVPALTSSYSVIQDVNINHNTFDKSFHISQSTSYQKIKKILGLSILNTFVSGELGEDILDIQQCSFDSNKKFRFLIIDSIQTRFPKPFGGYLGLQKYFLDSGGYSKISFIDYLYRFNALYYKTFTLNYTSVGGTISFGLDYNLTSKCYLSADHFNTPYWDCNLIRIALGNQILNLNDTNLIFDSLSDFITLPYYIKQYLVDDYLFKFLAHTCMITNEKEIFMLICDKVINIKGIPNIFLTLGDLNNNTTLIIHWENLVKSVDNNNSYIILIKVNNLDDKLLNIGLPGLIDNVIAFNLNEFSIGIINEKNIQINNSNNKIKYWILLTLQLCLIVGIVLIIVTRKKAKQTRSFLYIDIIY